MSVMDPDDGFTQRHIHDHLPESSPPVRTDDSEEQGWGDSPLRSGGPCAARRARGLTLRQVSQHHGGQVHVRSPMRCQHLVHQHHLVASLPGLDRVGSGRGERRCHDRLLELSIDRWVNDLTSTFRTRMTEFSRRSVESRGGSQPHEVNPQGSLYRRTSPRCVAR